MSGGGQEALVAAAEDGDEDVLAAFASVADWLGIGLANLVNVLNPQSIVLGGHLGEVYRIARERVDAQLDTALPAGRELVQVTSSSLGDDATLIGASEVAFTMLLDDPVGMLRNSAAS